MVPISSRAVRLTGRDLAFFLPFSRIGGISLGPETGSAITEGLPARERHG